MNENKPGDIPVYTQALPLHLDGETPFWHLIPSLTKRELFSAMAMQALIPGANMSEEGWGIEVAEHAAILADRLLTELSKNETTKD